MVSLLTIPLFVLLTLISFPHRAATAAGESGTQRQNPVLLGGGAGSGIQTVKAQNIELRSRWQVARPLRPLCQLWL